MTRRFEAFLFDFGGVFTDSPFTAVEDFGRAIGADPSRVSAIVFGSYEHDGEHPWHRLERGEIALEAARESILALGREGGLEVDIYQLFARMAGNDAGAASRGVLLEAVRGLRGAGYRTGIVTNNVREFGDGWRALIPVEELFEFVVDSSHSGVRKPDPRIFALALEQLGRPDPARCVFLDDHPANVAAAQALGMRAIHVGPDPAVTVEAIERLLD
ncbi:MAG: HAD family phosphatase [Gammaproteobacteria bacterium]|jgi:putative hydrolase of the HAD superfamily|nr:HAD family phosphatase [Gammaproteobacteria bacterium]MBK9468651.1 HAD family phosphatase [Gammaproteobacteria bacterium]MBP6482565.1 HAD family phosphatase [Pseudomonadales bacterium]MBP7911940.1 HAD family phosphatase [Pseudomonadales bacterium]